MVIKPGDVKKAADAKAEHIRERVAILEAKIDQQLRNEAPEPGQVAQVPLPMNESEEVVARVIADYQDQQWKVDRYQGHDRDRCNDLRFSYQDQ
jgi:hypothetical protein